MANKRAFIFDMDGTMYDNMRFHLQAWEKIVAELGSPLRGEELFKELYGKNKEVLDRIFGNEKFSGEEKEAISQRKDEYFREFYSPHLRLLDGLQQFLHRCREKNILLAVGTGGLRENIEFALGNTGIRALFSVVVCDTDVTNSKPDPETFLKAAEQLGVDPENAIVFEDVPKGIEAAERAGMKAVAILTSHEPAEFSKFDNVIRIVKDYTKLHEEELFENLLASSRLNLD